MDARVLRVAETFLPEGSVRNIRPLGQGNINDSFIVEGDGNFVLQRINTDVFKDASAVMRNIQLVTEHLTKKVLEAGRDTSREVLQFLSTKEGGTLLYTAEDGGCWRMYHFIDTVVTLQNVSSVGQAYKAAFTFGRFQSRLADFDATQLVETIPDFHNTEKRWEAFCKALEADPLNRAAEVGELIRICERFSHLATALAKPFSEGVFPVRVTHNDTKINNLLFDKKTGRGLCVIDLDTVMPATALYDFGDMVRSGANTTTEVDTDLSRVALNMDFYEAFLNGFLKGTDGRLIPAEKENLALSALVLTFELAIRFLGDYILGDVYFSIRTPRQNAERAANQLHLLLDMERKYEAMQKLITQ